MGFTFKIEKKTSYAVLSLEGNLLDKSSASVLLNDIDNLIAEEIKSFILDLSTLLHINSNGLNVFVTILTKARNAGGEVVISNVSEKIKPLLIMTKLNTVFTVTKSTKSAAGALKLRAKK